MGWILFIFWMASAGTGAWIGHRFKGRPLTGFALGVFLGWIGVAITALLPRSAEMRVQRRMASVAIDREAHARLRGEQPWTADTTGGQR